MLLRGKVGPQGERMPRHGVSRLQCCGVLLLCAGQADTWANPEPEWRCLTGAFARRYCQMLDPQI